MLLKLRSRLWGEIFAADDDVMPLRGDPAGVTKVEYERSMKDLRRDMASLSS
jgi:hypothetical protein